MNGIHVQRIRQSLPPMSTLRAFEAAVRLGTFKAAAEELGLTQSAISHQIKSLEAHFKTALFARQGNQVVPTVDGTAYRTFVVRAFSDLSRAGEVLLSKEQKEIVRVSASPAFAAFAALPNIENFKLKNSTLDLRLEARNTRVDFGTEMIDAAVEVGSPPFQGLQAHRLFRSKLAPLAHRTLREKFAPVKTAKDLAKMPLIELNNVPGLWEKWFAQEGGRTKVPPLNLSSDSLLAAIQMAEAGVGVLLAPFPLVAPAVASGRLEVLFQPSLLVEKPDFYLVYRKADAATEKIKVIRKWLWQVIAELGDATNANGVSW
jgi:LysR family glycine cleavage system transcriptional activator